MTPAFYIRPQARSGGASGTDGSGVIPNFFSPRIYHWPWVENSPQPADFYYFLGAAEFPLNDHALPGAMWDFLRVKEWRLTGTFTDASYESGDDRPNLSRTMSYVFPAGTVSHQGWDTDVDPFLDEFGEAWTDFDEAIRSNGYVKDFDQGGLTAAIQRTERVLYTNEEEESSYYYISIGIGIGKPVLYMPLTEGTVPVGGTLNEWGWVLPIRGGSAAGGGSFGSAEAPGGFGGLITYNGVSLGDEEEAGNWEITLAEESYYE